ncbi:MAG: hypothetical protein AAF944_19885 [Bacteroidota bacterium]
MRYLIMLLGVVCFCHTVHAKSPEEKWKFGSILLNSGQRFEGNLKFDLENDVVVLQKANRMLAFSAFSVKSFVAVDTVSGFTQSFFSLPYSDTRKRARLKFFQLVYDGRFALFVREKGVPANAVTTAHCPTRRNPHDQKKAFAHEYFVLLPNGNFQRFRAGRRHLTELFSLEEERVKQVGRYITKNDIDFSKQPDIIRLIYYCVNQETIASR